MGGERGGAREAGPRSPPTNRSPWGAARPTVEAALAHSAAAAPGANAAPTRPTSGTLTPATRSRARSSCAQPVSGRGPALVTGAAGPARARAAFVARSEPPPASRRGASLPLPPASKVRAREAETGSGRSGAEVPGAGPLPAAAARPTSASAGEGCAPGPGPGGGGTPGGAPDGRALGAARRQPR